jgi:hypothetical protein
MRHRVIVVLLTLIISGMLAVAQPVEAQGGGCKAFGQNIAGLARELGSMFGQTASSNAPLNPIVEAEQNALCD